MADRVRFTTANDTVNPGNASGFNGLPFVIPLVTFDFGIGVEAAHIFWRVKKFRASGTTITTADLSIYNYINEEFVTRERDLCLYGGNQSAHWTDGATLIFFLEISGLAPAEYSASASLADFEETSSVDATSYADGVFTLDAGGGNVYTVAPIEFWPYAAQDTSPIYNTTTGARLQSPLN